MSGRRGEAGPGEGEARGGGGGGSGADKSSSGGGGGAIRSPEVGYPCEDPQEESGLGVAALGLGSPNPGMRFFSASGPQSDFPQKNRPETLQTRHL